MPLRILALLALLVPLPLARQSLLPSPVGDGGATEVQVAIYVNDILEVDGAKQLLTADFFLEQRWHDPSQAGGVARIVSPNDVWTPNLIVTNEGRLWPKLPVGVQIDPGGNLRMVQRFMGTLSNHMPLADFPMDQQAFRIHVVAARLMEDIQLTELEARSGQSAQFTLADWDVEPGSIVDAPYYFAPADRELAGVAFEIRATRRLAFYVWKGIVPLSLVVLMALSVFWIDRGQLGPRLSVSVTSMLTLIAYRFLLGSLLPKLSYLTRMDWFTLGCTGLVFLALTGVVASGHLGQSGDGAAADRLDRTARFLLPVAFVAILAGSFFLG